MSDIVRWRPFREMMNLRDMMDRMFEESFFAPEWRPIFGRELAVDVVESDDDFTVKASIPGINPDELDISFSGRTLTIKGEVKEDEKVEEKRYYMRERRYGSFSRSITLPTEINADAIDAKYESGILKLRLPKAEEVKPKKISVHKVIEG